MPKPKRIDRKGHSIVSDARAKDHFESPGKTGARQHTLAVVRAAPGLWDPLTKRLRCDWAELAGGSWSHTVSMLETADVMKPGGFIGIDTDTSRINKAKAKRPDLTWLAGDLRGLVAVLCKTAHVGVLNFDGYLEVGTVEAAAFFTNIRPLIKRGIELFGSFALFSNNCLDSVFRHPKGPHGGKPSTAMRLHTKAIIEALDGYSMKRTLLFDDLLPANFEGRANSRNFSGPLGAFKIYSGDNLALRQAELSLVL